MPDYLSPRNCEVFRDGSQVSARPPLRSWRGTSTDYIRAWDRRTLFEPIVEKIQTSSLIQGDQWGLTYGE